MASKIQSLSNLRARLLQYVVSNHFLNTFGSDWWENSLLRHMREEGQTGSRSGDKYAVALRKYGRQIAFENLDTTVLCTIVLFDDYFKTIPNVVKYSDYELELVRNLHKLRNRVGHEEMDMSVAEQDSKLLLSYLRDAIDKLDLLNNEPKLAEDILRAYFEANGDKSSKDKDLKSFVDTSERFERAEKLFKWNIDEAIPIYVELANEGFVAAQKKLLYTYTHAVRFFDLTKAVGMAKKLCESGHISKEELSIYEKMRDAMALAIMGDPSSCAYVTTVLTDPDVDYIQSQPALGYIKKITKTFPSGLIHIGLDSYHKEIHELSFEELEALRKANDAEAYAETAYRMLFQKALDLTKAKRCAEKATKLGSKRGEYLTTLITKAIITNFNYQVMIDSLAKVGQNGYLPIIECFAEQGMDSDDAMASKAAVQWMQIGVSFGSKRCEEWLDDINQNIQAQEAISNNYGLMNEDLEDDFVHPKALDKADTDNAARISKLEADLMKKDLIIKIMGAAIAVLTALLIFT